MKNSIPFWGLLLAIWIIGGSFLYRSFCCAALGSGFKVMDGRTTVASSSQNFVFGFGGAEPEIPDPAKNALTKTVNYLKENPGKVLFLSGAFLDSENQPNLGFARGEKIETFLQELGLGTGRIIVNDQLAEDLPVENGKVYNSISFDVGDIPNYNLTIEDGDDFTANANNNLIFKHSQYAFEKPISDGVESAFSETVEYLKANPGRTLLITGLYHQDEENNSILPDLGLARATQIKNKLEDLGVSSGQIQTDSKLSDDLIFPGNNLYGGAIYNFDSSPDEFNKEEKIAAIEEELKIESIKLYFETNASTLDLSSEQRAYFAKLIDYLDSKASARVNVVGHTDNEGRTNYNKTLSSDRAAFIKKYLVTNGLKAQQIVTDGKGESQPIESNRTESGRAKNRRVEVFIQ